MTSTTTRRLRAGGRRADAAPERENRPEAPAGRPRRSAADRPVPPGDDRPARTREARRAPGAEPAPEGKGSTASRSAAKTASRAGSKTVAKTASRSAAKTGSRSTASKGAGKATVAAQGRTAGKGAKPGPARAAARPVAPDRTRGAEVEPGAAPRRARAATPVAQPAPRAPFVLLVVGLLGGALVSLLLLNTVLAEDAFTLTELQRSNKLLNQQRQALQEEIALEESPERLAQKARSLGMIEQPRPAFLDEPSGRVVGGVPQPVPHAAAAAAGALGVVGAPGVVVSGDQLPGWGAPAAPAAGSSSTSGSSGSVNSGVHEQGGGATGGTGGAAPTPAGDGR